MPTLRTPTPDELKSLDVAGVDVSKLPPQLLFPDGGGFPSIPTQQNIGTGQTIADTLKAHLGGIGGGGAGALAGAGIGAAIPVADLTGIPEVAGAAIGGLIGMTGGGVAGGYAGQKLQQAIEPTDYYNQLQQQAQLAAEQNPKTALGTDIIGSALASGGKPSLDALRAGRGLIGKLAGNALSDTDKQALIGSVLNAGVNPAINTGINYATTGQLPSGGDLAAQVGGGLVFSRQADWAAKLLGTHGAVMSDEPKPEVSNQTLQLEDTETPKQLAAPRRFFGDESGIIDIDAEPMLTPESTPEPALKVTNNPKTKLLPQVAGASNSGGQLTVAPEILQKVIDNGATKPVSVQRIFPKLNLSDNDAAEVLRQANLLAELHINNPANQIESENQNATGIRENQGLPSQSGQATQEGQAGSSGNLVDTSPRSQEQPIPQKSSGDTSQETKIVPAASTKDILPSVSLADANKHLEESGDVINSPLSDYNRYQVLQQQAKESTAKGIYPSKEVQNEIEQLKNKYGGNPPPPFPENRVLMPLHIQQHILNGDATTGSVLQKLASTPDHPFAPLAKELFENGDKQSLTTPWVHDNTLDQGGQRSHYSVGKNRVAIGTGSAGDSRVVMEEAIHSLTSNKIPNFTGRGAEHLAELQKYLKTGTNPHVKDLINAYLETAKAKGWQHFLSGTNSPKEGVANSPDDAVRQGLPYAMGNLHEFIAQAMKDPEFQRTLDWIKTEDGRTVWQKIVDAVRNLLGLSPKAGSMLDRVLRSSGELVHQLPNPKIGERVAPPVNTNIKERNGDFLLNAKHLIDNPDKLGLKPNIHGAFNGTQLLGTLRNKLSKTEYDILKDAGIEKAFNGRIISQKEASEWIKNNSPKVEVRKFGEAGQTEGQKRASQIKHELDTLSAYVSYDGKGRMIPEPQNGRWTGSDTRTIEQAHKLVNEYNNLSPDDIKLSSNLGKAHWQSIAPKSEKDMPGYVEISVVAPHKETKFSNPGHQNLGQPNTLGWVRGYMENVGGKKVFHVIEVQSDWAQRVRDMADENVGGRSPEETAMMRKRNIDRMSDPLLPHYERLALKAAIDHARSEGATKIAISDAETAMMTEGHDKGAELYSDTLKGLKVLQETRTDPGHRELTATGDYENRHGQTWIDVIAVNGDRLRLKVINKDGTLDSNNRPSNELNEWLDKPDGKYTIAQEPGMRLHYDQTLPKIAEELTGGKGERTSFGTHKMAVEPSHHDPDQSDLIERKDLIFHNPDGSPKTDVSARAYDISHLPDREPMQYGKQFAAPKQEASAEDIRNLKTLTSKVTPDTRVPFGKAGKFFQNAIDRAREVAPKVADAYHRFFNDHDKFYGEMYGKVKQVMQDTGFTKKDGERLMEAMHKEEFDKKPVPETFFRTPAQARVWKAYKAAYRQQGEAAIKDNQPVIDAHTGLPRMRKLNETSHPIMINPKVVQTIRDNTNHTAIEQLKKDFLADQKTRKIDPFIAKENLATHIRAIQGSLSAEGKGNLNYFNANRQAQGIPLPKSWSRQDFEQNLKAYSIRNASDRAHFRDIESNPGVMAQLGETKDAWNQKIPRTDEPIVTGNQAVRALMSSSHGEVGSQMLHDEKAASSLATATFIASPALSGIHIPIANMVAGIGLAPNPIIAAKAITNAISKIAQGVVTARANGFKVDATTASSMWDKNLTAAERLQGFAAIVRKIATLNDLTTKATIGYTQSFMETIVQSKLNRANKGGDVTAQQWLRKLDPDYRIGKVYSDSEVGQLATKAMGYIHGTSDARTMPAWMLGDSEISGFFSLAHWSIGQTNRFMSDIYTPALKGDYVPLLTTLFGSAIGGYLIKELREDISGKKSPIPSLSEIASSDRGLSGNAGPLAYNMIAAMQYAGFGGMFSQIAKYPFDAIYKNIPQGATFPLDEVAGDLTSTLHNVSSAIANDPNLNWVDLASAVTKHIISQDFRLGREAYNQAINNGMITGLPAERKELADKMGQLRRFEQVEGLPFEDQSTDASNPYMNLEQKNFKTEQDIPTAIKELPGLVTNIIDTYKSNPDVMMNKLKALKENQYATFPSLDTAPLSFYKYLGYLQREEGPQAAQNELMDYMKHKVTNEAKASVVP